MSQELINHSPDIQKLIQEGYNVEIRGSFLLLHDIPYVNSKREIHNGILVSPLTLAGNRTAKPNHVVFFQGEYPCKKNGSPIAGLQHQSKAQKLGNEIDVDHSFSNKPKPDGYTDYFQKMDRYVEIISSQAIAIDSTVTPKTGLKSAAISNNSVFEYIDTHSARSGIENINQMYSDQCVAIVGLGGTGSYVLDLVSKTPVNQIHLYDGDDFLQHNAFRAPGAAPLEKLVSKPKKTDYYEEIYSAIRKNIFSHSENVDESNISQLSKMSFVFLCIDANDAKKTIIDYLIPNKIPFVDVGMGVHIADNQLLGMVRTTLCTEAKHDHVGKRISLNSQDNNEYATNIQIADLNMLNASFAIIKWKKFIGFYQDFNKEYNITYSINDNLLLNDENEP